MSEGNIGHSRLLARGIATLVTLCAIAFAAPLSASAATFTVNSPADSTDGTCDSSPDCTLREAITAANGSGTADTIAFSVGGTITLTSNLPALLSLDTINGATAPGYAVGAPVVEIDGAGGGVTVGIALGNGAALNAVVVNGVGSGRGVQLNSNNVVTGCFVGTNLAGTAADMNLTGIYVGGAGNTIGGPTIAGRNVISGNFASGVEIASPSPTNLVTGNYIGTNAAGNAAVPNTSDGVLMSANAQIGSAGNPPNVISGNGDDGIVVGGAVTSGVIENNLIGTSASGDAALANAGTGVEVTFGAEVTVGGAAAGAGNVISGNGVYGITLDNATTTIQRNLIGTSDDGTIALGNAGGIFLTGGSDGNVIGSGVDPSLGNTIANSTAAGVVLDPAAASGNDVRGNSIRDNGGQAGWLGIDLADPTQGTITPNDIGDGDTGPNDLQNHPSITRATLLPQSGGVAVSGSLNSQPSATYSIEFYANTSCDDTGAGEGAVFLGSRTVVTDDAGDAPFTAQLPQPPAGDDAISATATNAGGSTSEFSLCVKAAADAPPTAPPQPIVGETVLVTPVSGKVLVRLPGTTEYVPLESLTSVPVGSIIDARRGRVRLTVASGGATQSAEFFSGRFKVTQSTGAKPITDLKLLDHADGCGARASTSGSDAAASKKKKKKKSGQLWGDGKGDYRTTGDNGSATVRGTKWQTVNRCDGTLFVVKRGVVRVRDFRRRKTITLRAGQKYLAKAK